MEGKEMLEVSESLILTGSGIGVGCLGLVLWYIKSILITSRCEEAQCCCFHWRNKPIGETELTNVLSMEQTPTLSNAGANHTLYANPHFDPQPRMTRSVHPSLSIPTDNNV